MSPPLSPLPLPPSPFQSGGEGCANDSECASELCDVASLTCLYANGESCTATTSALCASGVCGLDGTCQGKGEGSSCTSNGECASGACDADGTCEGVGIDGHPLHCTDGKSEAYGWMCVCVGVCVGVWVCMLR
jgi:hypothetical protein